VNREVTLRCAIFFLGAAALLTLATGPIRADVDNLEGGVFIAHHVPDMMFTNPPPAEGWCQHYLDNFAIADSASQINRIDTTEASVWFVIAAWVEDKEFLTVQFGLGGYNGNAYGFILSECGGCFPAEGLELPSSGWPGPHEGIAITVTTLPWTGNYVPVYCFWGHAYEEAVLPLGVDETMPIPFGGFVNNAVPAQMFDATCFGAMGIFTSGIPCGPIDPPPPIPHVCCVGPDCFLVMSELECNLLHGVWYPNLDSCDPNPCVSVCCIGEECVLTYSQIACQASGGIWRPDLGHSCEPNPCPSTPVRRKNWGNIKTLYGP
jgi:hypothetical protein